MKSTYATVRLGDKIGGPRPGNAVLAYGDEVIMDDRGPDAQTLVILQAHWSTMVHNSAAARPGRDSLALPSRRMHSVSSLPFWA
jgi:hypothetical protein